MAVSSIWKLFEKNLVVNLRGKIRDLIRLHVSALVLGPKISLRDPLGCASVRNKTPKDNWSHNWRHRNGELSPKGKIYFSRRVHGHMGTACTKGQGSLSCLISLIWLLIWIGPDQKFTIFSIGWNSTNLGEGLRYTAWRATFKGKGAKQESRSRTWKYRQCR
jgi:hypothetical protein